MRLIQFLRSLLNKPALIEQVPMSTIRIFLKKHNFMIVKFEKDLIAASYLIKFFVKHWTDRVAEAERHVGPHPQRLASVYDCSVYSRRPCLAERLVGIVQTSEHEKVAAAVVHTYDLVLLMRDSSAHQIVCFNWLRVCLRILVQLMYGEHAVRVQFKVTLLPCKQNAVF